MLRAAFRRWRSPSQYMRRLTHRYRQQAGSYTVIGFTRFKIVGASLLAMEVNDNAGCLNERVAQTIFAGKPAPTGIDVRF